ncbi:MFS transporter [Geodermatophilus sp. SYSU D00758]
MAGLPRALAPLRHPRYRLLAGSLGLSLLTNSMWTVAVVWQVVALGGGPTQLSLVTALASGGMLASTLLGGVLADRVPQRHVLLVVAVVQTVAIAGVAVLSLSGLLTLGQLAAVALAGGLVNGVYYPAYSAQLPALLPEEELLAANGLEGTLRPVLFQAAGPAVAGGVLALTSPGWALAVTAVAALGAAWCVAALPATAVRRVPERAPVHPVRGLAADLGEGVRYVVRTPWLRATLLFASLMLLVMLGPFEVLAPFAIRDRTGGGPLQHALVLAAFGLGGAAGSLVVASRRLPRRYLTVTTLLWGLGCVPMAAFGLTSSLAVMIGAGLVTGAALQAGMVLWGTMLQRRVPPALLGRVAGLDFFVSTAFLPLSMGLAGPVSAWIGLTGTFLLAGLVPPVLAVVTLVAARLPADELAHPLDRDPERAAAPGP